MPPPRWTSTGFGSMVQNMLLIVGVGIGVVMGNVNFADYESRMWFDKVLRDNGFFQKLEEMGIQDGDIVSLYDFEFEYQR